MRRKIWACPAERSAVGWTRPSQIVGMSDYSTHAPHLLSGGQKQRVAIAGIIAMRPRHASSWTNPPPCWIPLGGGRCWRPSQQLNRELGITVVLITHHMDEAALADRLIVMTDGNVIADGAP